MRFAFFGTSEFAVVVLEKLCKAGFAPALVITNPDAPKGRKLVLTPSPVKTRSNERSLSVTTPSSLIGQSTPPELLSGKWDFFVVAAYGKLIPPRLLELSRHGALNVHPSLLPKLRGASPVRSAILNDMRETGVTVMLMDEKLDHGPILAQKHIAIAPEEWPLRGRALDDLLAEAGGELLIATIPLHLEGKITPRPQAHEKATYCAKITKEMALIHLDPHRLPSGRAAYEALLKIRAFDGWPEAYFMHEGRRVKIKDARLFPDGRLCLLRVLPEGGREMDFVAFLKEI
jgi:methionyl-tRNA formyltransferase